MNQNAGGKPASQIGENIFRSSWFGGINGVKSLYHRDTRIRSRA
jgi:hypothetical protein